jgi:hypothetical protein
MTIDTTTTAGKIAVMQAYERGEVIEARFICEQNVRYRFRKGEGDEPEWQFKTFNYSVGRTVREFYIVEYPFPLPYGRSAYSTAGEAFKQATSQANIIKVREVIE